MSLLLELDRSRGVRVSGDSPARSTPVPPKPSNGGQGDSRKRIVPMVKPLGPSVEVWEGGRFLSMADWLAGGAEGDAVLLQPSDEPGDLAGRLDGLALIAIDFHRIGDGRGYSQAFLLRRRLGYTGPLRAVGAVTADQALALVRVGFDTLALREDQSVEAALAALEGFPVAYQSTLDLDGALRDRDAANFNAQIALLERSLRAIAARHERAALASSLSAEDMVITDAIARLRLPIDVFTLDTGRLHPETLALVSETKQRYGLDIAVWRPDGAAVAAYVVAHGRDGFYDGVAQRKLCCSIRKVAPLNEALLGRDAWLSGQRREQAITRGALAEQEHDRERDMQKYNPLAAWSWADVLAYASRFDVPMNALYGGGYVSIGCEPCTRAIRPGEDPRSGRWWWESQDTKECGLHTTSVTAR